TEAALLAVNAEIERAQQRESLAKQLRGAQADAEAAKTRREQCRKTKEALASKKGESEERGRQMAAIDAEMSSYDELETRRERIRTLGEEITAGREDVKTSEGAIKGSEESLAAAKKERDSLAQAGEHKARLLAVKKELEKRSEDVEQFAEDKEELIKLCRDYKKAQELYGTTRRCMEEARFDANEARMAFLDAQAGLMAEGLSEGEPCPVCGSIHHPAKAVRPEHAPTQAEVERKEKNADRLVEQANKASEDAHTKQGSFKTARDAFVRRQAELFGEEPIENLDERIREERERIDEASTANAAQIRTEDDKIARRTRLEELIPAEEEKLREAQKKLGEQREALVQKQTSHKEETQAVKALAEKLAFPDKKAAEEKLSLLQTQENAYKEQTEQAQKDELEAVKDLSAAEASLKELRTQIAQIPEADGEKLAASLQELQAEKTRCVDAQKNLHARLTANASARENIVKRLDESAQLEKKRAWMKSLADTAAGKLAGRDRLSLETFVQMTYFDRILVRANTHLMRMSGSKYDLVRKKTADNLRSQSGLELNVIDHYNGTERDVKTLSGGESFIASLSLALGLAEEIQMSAGGIRLDTMFVDEGFGTLDEETLDQAMRALRSLGEEQRLIGIISHVGELRREIDRQVIVVKEKSGGSRAEVRVE
ncbi:MAG: hypothetical protein IJU99_05520, partial [Lachnospiraceae bacterium]|nr:hypothetical protein [Lachnospiraceae bacterium]